MKVTKLNYDRYQSALHHLIAAVKVLGDTPGGHGETNKIWSTLMDERNKLNNWCMALEIDEGADK